MVVSTA